MSSHHHSFGNSVSGAPRLGMKQRAQSIDASEYTHALQVLDEETMSEACSLLLSDSDYQQPTDGSSDYDKLLTILSNCNQAAKIVEQRAAATKLKEFPTVGGQAPPPSTFAQTPRAAAKSKAVIMQPPASRRVSLAQIAAARRVKRPAGPLKRETSDSSMASTASNSSNSASKHVHKKPRVVQPSNDKQFAAPPPEALDFLQALNNPGSKSATKKSTKASDEASSSEPEAPDISGRRHPRAARAKQASSSGRSRLRNARSLESSR